MLLLLKLFCSCFLWRQKREQQKKQNGIKLSLAHKHTQLWPHFFMEASIAANVWWWWSVVVMVNKLKRNDCAQTDSAHKLGPHQILFLSSFVHFGCRFRCRRRRRRRRRLSA